jgi:hypothetical protein
MEAPDLDPSITSEPPADIAPVELRVPEPEPRDSVMFVLASVVAKLTVELAALEPSSVNALSLLIVVALNAPGVPSETVIPDPLM